MARRLGLIVTLAALALLATSEGALACRCMNRLMNSCGCRSSCCWTPTCQSCCEPVGCCDPCGQPAAAAAVSPATAPTESKAAPFFPLPAAPEVPHVAPQPQQEKPAVMRDVKPETAVAPKVEPKPVGPPLAPTPPAIAAPKEVETPAEPRSVAKPELPPVLPPAKPAEPALPEKPPIVAPKAAEPAPAETAPKPAVPEGLPTLPPPAKPDATKPAVPEKAAPEKTAPQKKDDPFGTRNDVETLRQWTDASGKYHIEARFVSFQDGTVRLQKANGRYFRIKYDRLCAADRDFVLHNDEGLFAAE